MYGNNTARTFQSIYRGPRRPRFVPSVAATLGVSSEPAVVGSDGTMYLCSPVEPPDGGRMSWTQISAWTLSGKVRWRCSLAGRVFGSPAVAPDGTFYVFVHMVERGYDGCESSGPIRTRLYGVSSSGRVRWQAGIDGALPSAPAVGSDGTVYFTAEGRIGPSVALHAEGRMAGPAVLHAFDSRGRVKRRRRLPGPLAKPVAIGSDSTVYAVTSGTRQEPRGAPGHVFAFRPDGGKKWSRKLDAGPLTSPAIGRDGTVYVGVVEKGLRAPDSDVRRGSLVAFNRDGRRQWAARFGSVAGPPAIGPDGTVYMAARDRDPQTCVLHAIAPDGSERWSRKWPFTVSTPVVDRDGTLYFTITDIVVALRPNGRRKWKIELSPTSATEFGQPIIAADGLICFSGWGDRLHTIGER